MSNKYYGATLPAENEGIITTLEKVSPVLLKSATPARRLL